MKDMMIEIIIEGAKTPIVATIDHASILGIELDKAGKKWRLGKTC